MSERKVELLERILDNSERFILVCDPDNYEMVYANCVAKSIAVHSDQPYEGEKCYRYMMGADEPCEHCPMKKMEVDKSQTYEVDNGTFAFRVTARYMDWDDRKLFTEFGIDITNEKRAQKRYESQIALIKELVPDEQGIFHVDLTDDRWISSSGNIKIVEKMQDFKDVNSLVMAMVATIPDERAKERFAAIFNREALLKLYGEGKHEIQMETKLQLEGISERWSRIAAVFISNPDTKNVECVIYGVDITEEKAEHERVGKELLKLQKESEEAIKAAMEKFTVADRDRRIDFLTGLKNRLDLFEVLRDSLNGIVPPINAMYMIDLDDFKRLNDHCGHKAGDECLQKVGAALKAYGKENKIIFYRYGGEEILGLGFANAKSTIKVAEEVLDIIRDLKIPCEKLCTGFVTASLGYTENNRRYEKMIEHADVAMYKAKELGKNQAVSYEDLKIFSEKAKKGIDNSDHTY